MRPKTAGITLLTASIVVCIVSASVITSPTWGVAGAAGIAAALASGGLGVMWMSRTTWGPEPRPEIKDTRALDARRARRSALVAGIVLIALAAAATVLLLVTRPGEIRGVDVVRIGLPVLAYLVFGIVLVRFGRSPLPAATDQHGDEDEAPEEDAAPEDDVSEPTGWVTVSRRSPAVVGLYSLPAVAIGAYVLFQLSTLSWRVSNSPTEASAVGIGVAVVLGVAVTAAVVIVVNRRVPNVRVNAAEQRVRAGAREASWSELSAAKLSVAALWPGAPRTLFLTLEGPDKLRVPLVLRVGAKRTMSDLARSATERMIAGSGIEMPRAPEDPTGAFSRFNFPQHVSRDDAVTLVTRPPRSSDPLPTPYQ